MEDLPPSIEQTTELPSAETFQLSNPTQQHDDIATMDFVPLEIPQPPDPQPAMNMDHNEAGVRRSQRVRKQPVKLKDYTTYHRNKWPLKVYSNSMRNSHRKFKQ
jgi:hypothetical protein